MFIKKLEEIQKKNNSLVCVGLDSDFSKLPHFLKSQNYPQLEFNKAIIEATHDLVCAYKMNSAFYEARGGQGLIELKMTLAYLHSHYPEIPTIDDAKRADIGNTNMGYVTSIFDEMGFDSLTLHPYLGREALQPFLDRKDKGLIILCRTSNPGAGEFQDLKVGKKPLYQVVAEQVVKNWNTNNNCLLVVGATYPKELAQIRTLAPNMPFLVPGIGAQGGDVEKTVKAGLDRQGRGMIINSSRGIIFAGSDKDFAQKAREATIVLQNEINKWR